VKKIFLLVIMVFLISVVSCSSEMLKNEKLNDTDTSMEMSYDKFSGERSKTVTLKSNTEIKVDIVTNDGDIALSIVDESGNKAYIGNALKTSSFSVTVDKDTDYTIKVVAKSHEGSYKIAWE